MPTIQDETSPMYRLNWGIIGPGEIARAFGRDILLDPKTRDVANIVHVVVAAASSSSQQRAKDFLEYVGAPSAQAYGSYTQLVKDSNVDIVYVATPHSHHFQQVTMCLDAGKHVLCEKPMAVNAAQAEKMVATARSKGLFLMEAAWTRYMPVTTYVREAITSDRIGTVHRVFADLSTFVSPDLATNDHRLFNLELAGGALLDIGVYALTWTFIALYGRNASRTSTPQPTVVGSAVEKYRTGVDGQTSILLSFPGEAGCCAHGFVTTSMLVSTELEESSSTAAVRIQGTKGEIRVFHPIYRPEKTQIALHDGSVEEKTWTQPGPGKGSGWKNGFRNEFGGGFHPEGEGHGMFWEADECAQALQKGHLESSIHPLHETVALLKVVDQVRLTNGIKYPAQVESAVYPC